MSDEQFVVEKIVAMRVCVRREFLLKWEGYSESQNSWEPEENLDCPNLVKEFMKKEQKGDEEKEEDATGGMKRKREDEDVDVGEDKHLDEGK